MLKSLDVKAVQIMGDSQLVINQLLGEYRCNSLTLEGYLEEAQALLEYFTNVIISHIPRTSKEIANDLAQHVSGYKFMIPNVNTIKDGNALVINHQFRVSANLRQELIQYLANPSTKMDYKLKQKVLKYVLIVGELFRRS